MSSRRLLTTAAVLVSLFAVQHAVARSAAKTQSATAKHHKKHKRKSSAAKTAVPSPNAVPADT